MPQTAPTLAPVLVVDDDEMLRTGLCELLADDGFEVMCAGHGRDALVQLEALPEQPALIVIDLMMPVMNGWQLYEELRTNTRYAGVPIIVLSGEERALPRASRLRVSAVFAKPCNVDALLAAVATHAAAVATPADEHADA